MSRRRLSRTASVARTTRVSRPLGAITAIAAVIVVTMSVGAGPDSGIAQVSCSSSPSASLPAATGDAINARCPISGEPVTGGVTAEHAGHTVGLCCGGCRGTFVGWSDTDKTAYVNAILARTGRGSERIDPSRTAPPAGPAADAQGADDPSTLVPTLAALPPGTLLQRSDGHPYPLETCAVAVGSKLGSMGKPIVMQVGGREIRLCCAGCTAKAENDTAAVLASVDARIIAAWRMHYPIDTCIVDGAKLDARGGVVDHVHRNRLVRFCGDACRERFAADPVPHLAKLDTMIVAQQAKTYPLVQCIVMPEERLDVASGSTDVMYENRLVRLCCKACAWDLDADPRPILAQLDAAYAATQRANYPLDTCVVSGERLGSMGEPVEIVAGDRLVRLCCSGCEKTFRQSPDAPLAKLRAAAGG